MAESDYLVQQFRICRKGHILLLYGRVDEGGLVSIGLASSVVLAILLVFVLLLLILQDKVDTDAFFQDKLNPRLSDAMPEFHKLGRYARCLDRKGIHATKVLIVCILCKLLYDSLVRHIAKMLQYEETDHQSDRLCRPASLKRGRLESSIDSRSQKREA